MLEATWAETFGRSGHAYSVVSFTGEATDEAIGQLVADGKREGVRTLVGCGGGKARGFAWEGGQRAGSGTGSKAAAGCVRPGSGQPGEGAEDTGSARHGMHAVRARRCWTQRVRLRTCWECLWSTLPQQPPQTPPAPLFR